MSRLLAAKAKRTSKNISNMKTKDFESHMKSHHPEEAKKYESKKPYKMKKDAVLGLKKMSKHTKSDLESAHKHMKEHAK